MTDEDLAKFQSLVDGINPIFERFAKRLNKTMQEFKAADLTKEDYLELKQEVMDDYDLQKKASQALTGLWYVWNRAGLANAFHPNLNAMMGGAIAAHAGIMEAGGEFAPAWQQAVAGLAGFAMAPLAMQGGFAAVLPHSLGLFFAIKNSGIVELLKSEMEKNRLQFERETAQRQSGLDAKDEFERIKQWKIHTNVTNRHTGKRKRAPEQITRLNQIDRAKSYETRTIEAVQRRRIEAEQAQVERIKLEIEAREENRIARAKADQEARAKREARAPSTAGRGQAPPPSEQIRGVPPTEQLEHDKKIQQVLDERRDQQEAQERLERRMKGIEEWHKGAKERAQMTTSEEAERFERRMKGIEEWRKNWEERMKKQKATTEAEKAKQDSERAAQAARERAEYTAEFEKAIERRKKVDKEKADLEYRLAALMLDRQSLKDGNYGFHGTSGTMHKETLNNFNKQIEEIERIMAEREHSQDEIERGLRRYSRLATEMQLNQLLRSHKTALEGQDKLIEEAKEEIRKATEEKDVKDDVREDTVQGWTRHLKKLEDGRLEMRTSQQFLERNMALLKDKLKNGAL